MQGRVRDPAELKPEAALGTPGAHDQQVGAVRGVHQHLPGGALDGAAHHVHRGREVVEGLVERLDGLLLVHLGGGVREPRVVGQCRLAAR